MVQFPLTQHIPNGTTLESSHKKHSFLETQLTHQHMLDSKHDKQLSKEDGTGCRVTSGSKLHIFPLVQPSTNPFEHNTTFTRSQNIQTPVVTFLLYLSQTCSGFGLLVCRCFLVQFGFPQPFLERCYGLHNTSPALSTFTAHQTAFPRQNDFFCCLVKRDASAEEISVEWLVLQGLSLTVFLSAPSALTF